MFKQAIVLEILSNPQLFSDENIKLLLKYYGVEDLNQNFDIILPNNTIIATYANIAGQFTGKPIVCLPFFSSHMILPIKAGERVWLYEENVPSYVADHINGKITAALPHQTYYSYWISRISEPRIAEDVNLTHYDRKWNENNRNKKVKEKTYEFINGGGPLPNEKGSIKSGISLLLDNTDDGYKFLINNSISNQLVQLEAVPKLYPRPGEYIIQGSNNSYIMLGSDRELTKPTISEKPLAQIPIFWNKKVNDYNQSLIGKSNFHDKNSSLIKFPVLEKTKKSGTGSIDIVAGKVAKQGNFKIISVESEKRTELDKMPTATEEKVGISAFQAEDIQNFSEDKSRIYVSEKTNVNLNFGISWAPNTPTNDGIPAIIQKSDLVKSIGRKEVALIFQENVNSTKESSSYIFLNSNIEIKSKNNGKVSIGNGTDELIKSLYNALSAISNLADTLILTSTGPGQLNPSVKRQIDLTIASLKNIGNV